MQHLIDKKAYLSGGLNLVMYHFEYGSVTLLFPIGDDAIELFWETDRHIDDQCSRIIVEYYGDNLEVYDDIYLAPDGWSTYDHCALMTDEATEKSASIKKVGWADPCPSCDENLQYTPPLVRDGNEFCPHCELWLGEVT